MELKVDAPRYDEAREIKLVDASLFRDFEILRHPKRKENRIPQLVAFANAMQKVQGWVDFKMSSRGWCYTLEGFNLITKGEFDRAEEIINECRKGGYLPIDFTAENERSKILGWDKPMADYYSISEYVAEILKKVSEIHKDYHSDYWEQEKYYPVLAVEKIDLINLFEPICTKFHIPHTNTSGWSDINQRADLTKIFRWAEHRGLEPVFLYCGDHDPIGLDISNQLRKNLEDLIGGTKYNPRDLIVDRFGLNYNYIIEQGLTWIDNLISSTGKDMTKPDKDGWVDPRVLDYVAKVGKRKCEANAIVIRPGAGRKLFEDTILKYLSEDAEERFRELDAEIESEFADYFEVTGLADVITQIKNEVTEDE